MRPVLLHWAEGRKQWRDRGIHELPDPAIRLHNEVHEVREEVRVWSTRPCREELCGGPTNPLDLRLPLQTTRDPLLRLDGRAIGGVREEHRAATSLGDNSPGLGQEVRLEDLADTLALGPLLPPEYQTGLRKVPDCKLHGGTSGLRVGDRQPARQSLGHRTQPGGGAAAQDSLFLQCTTPACCVSRAALAPALHYTCLASAQTQGAYVPRLTRTSEGPLSKRRTIAAMPSR